MGLLGKGMSRKHLGGRPVHAQEVVVVLSSSDTENPTEETQERQVHDCRPVLNCLQNDCPLSFYRQVKGVYKNKAAFDKKKDGEEPLQLDALLDGLGATEEESRCPILTDSHCHSKSFYLIRCPARY